jgi:predicted  nucleic acid-binding Zn-ribbon protein
LAKGGKVTQLEKQLKDLDIEIGRVKTQLELKEDSIRDEEKRIVEFEKGIEDVRTVLTFASNSAKLKSCCDRPASRPEVSKGSRA